MNYKELSQLEINKVFLKACKSDDIELVKYLLTNNELPLKAQLNISKQTGFVNDKKQGMFPLIYSVQYNAKKVYKYFLEEIDWFSTLTQEGKLEVLGKSSYANDLKTFEYVFKKFEEKTKINNYQKPFLMTKILESVIDKNSDKIFDYLMTLSKEYKEHINTKNDLNLRRAAKSSPYMLKHMLNNENYKELNTELYLSAFHESQKSPDSALILFQYGVEKKWVDIWLTKYAQSYIRDKIRDYVFKSYHDKLISYIHEEQIKLSYPERLVDLANENVQDYFFIEDEDYKAKKKSQSAPVLEYAIKHNLLTKETRENILYDIAKKEYNQYHNLLCIISNYPEYGKNLDLNKVFQLYLQKKDISKERFKNIIQILDLDFDKKIKVNANDFLFFKEMQNIKSYPFESFAQDYDERVKKVFIDYYFWTDEKLMSIYENNHEMQKVVKLKELNMKLSNEIEKITPINTKKHKI